MAPVKSNAVEAARAAVLALHAAAGLSMSASREGTRLLRAAEGLCRAAVAVLTAPGPEPPPLTPTVVAPAAAPQRRRRPRGRRGRAAGKGSGGFDEQAMEADKGEEDFKDVVMPGIAEVPLKPAAAFPVGAVVLHLDRGWQGTVKQITVDGMVQVCWLRFFLRPGEPSTVVMPPDRLALRRTPASCSAEVPDPLGR